MAQYRKKPIVIEAVQFHGENYAEILSFVKTLKAGRGKNGALRIPTLEGVMEATPGDWIIKGVAGEFYPCKPDIFEATYEKVEHKSDCALHNEPALPATSCDCGAYNAT